MLPPAVAGQATDVLIVGGGASGTTAAIQAARQGASVTVLESSPWVGGMLTAAGVSAIDGNHRIAGGLWAEFRRALREHYGGAAALETGWVSNTLFEPKVGQQILRELLAAEPNVDLRLGADLLSVSGAAGDWTIYARQGTQQDTLRARVLIDATELGDLAALLTTDYDIGMDAPHENDIIQDLTYVLTLRDYGPGTDRSIPRPPGYDVSRFECACETADPGGEPTSRIDCTKMLAYGKLPNDRYMINWPNCGNDHYVNLIERSPEQRRLALDSAKAKSLQFLYFLQQELGYTNLGLDDDQYPTEDGLPLLPYHRESRRYHGKARFTIDDLVDPYQQPSALYRTGIAVGDYPIDHHHKERPDAPKIDFINIKAPAYSLPLGTLVPKTVEGLVLAEKSISVSNIVNGTTRLQPVVLGIGQAAGALAALAATKGGRVSEVGAREVQTALLEAGAYLIPFLDVPPEHPDFATVQRIGACGILKGEGIPYKWANQLWFYPERTVSEFELVEGLRPFFPELEHNYSASGQPLTLAFIRSLHLRPRQAIPTDLAEDTPLNRLQTARLIDAWLNPFRVPVDYHGQPQQ